MRLGWSVSVTGPPPAPMVIIRAGRVECRVMTRVAIFVPLGVDFAEVNQQLYDYCRLRRYDIVAVDRGDGGWWHTLEAAHELNVDVILAACTEHLPAGRAPRVEVAELAADPDVPADDRPRQRRPRPL